MKSMNIIFRCCAPVMKASGYDNIRPFKMTKEEIILKCLKSVLISGDEYENRIFFDIVDDSSSDEFRNKVLNIMKESKFKFNFHKIQEKSNGKSLMYCYGLAEKSKYDIIYFCEDDYFHLKNAIPSIFDVYDNKIIGTDNFAVHPTDYPDRYIHLEPSFVFWGKYNHWRSILHTTGTFILTRKAFLKYKKYCFDFADFNSSSTGGESETINHIWQNIPLIAPVESLAAHLNIDTLPRFVDWESEIKKIKIN